MSVKSTKVYTPQQYVEAMTGLCFYFEQDDTVAEIQEKLDKHCLHSLWNYPLTEIDHIVENKLDVVLVDVSGFYNGFEIVPKYRWFEVPADFEEDA